MGKKEVHALDAVLQHGEVVPSNLWVLFKEAVLTDLTIRSQDRCFNVHRVVLAAGSPYFRALLTSNMSDSSVTSLEISEVSKEALEAVLAFMYKGEVHLNDFDFAAQVLAAADRFLMTDLAHLTLQAIKKNATCEDFPVLLSESKRLGLQDLESFAFASCCEHFRALPKTDSFHSLPFSHVLELFQSKFIVIEKEVDAVEVALSWLDRNGENASLATQLMDAINFVDIAPEELPRFWPRLAPHCTDDNVCRRILCGLGRSGSSPRQSRWLLQVTTSPEECKELAEDLLNLGISRPDHGRLCVELLSRRKAMAAGEDQIRRYLVDLMQTYFQQEIVDSKYRTKSTSIPPRCLELLCLTDVLSNMIGRNLLSATIITNHVMPFLIDRDFATGWLLLCNVRHGLLERASSMQQKNEAFAKCVGCLKSALKSKASECDLPWLKHELEKAVEEL
eukprot:TRINITY_DN28160_c0_g2_i1.p1 TRINITY_DN28160_c0_g2~~TRINITY_DN28160_c0_g2_i1.p1  ORF type:complete len:449 (-),score=52.17 TRINITY_DN28160_c0_g2_i1:54-1400(-)